MKQNKSFWIGIGIGFVILVVIGCLIAVAVGAIFIRQTANNIEQGDFSFDDMPISPSPTPALVRPQNQTVEDPVSDLLVTTTIQNLESSVVPENDPPDLALRLMGIKDIPLTVSEHSVPRRVGEKDEFWVLNTSTNYYSKVKMTLQYVTEHSYFWVDDRVSYDEDELQTLAETFEEQIYPTDRDFFGSEWTPGVDNDPHIYILYSKDVGSGAAGFYGSNDEYHFLAHENSNMHETFYINADNTSLGGEYIYGTLAHEFQHMIHWAHDRNESSWINEGFSMLAELLNGFDTGGFDYYFIMNPDFQLNNWNELGQSTANYGASFLYAAYFLDRLGTEASQALAAHPANGMDSVDLVLHELDIRDSLSGDPISADDIALDWALTNFLLDEDVGDGRFYYHNYRDAGKATATEVLTNCGSDPLLRDVHQYGTDYISITCPGQHTLRFTGSIQTTLLPIDEFSGDYSFWSNKGDESDMTMTRSFDFTENSGSLTLSYRTWYDIEEDYDYVYLLSSTDGENWDIITTPSGTAEDPSGNSYGWAYNGLSGDGPIWIEETIDISHLSGKDVQLRFEYVTDAAVNGEGLLIDDIAIPEIDYYEDFESGDGGWESKGFVRVANVLPQNFRLALIRIGDQTTVEYLSLDENNSLDINFEINGDVEEVVLVVMGTTRVTRQVAAYQLEFLE